MVGQQRTSSSCRQIREVLYTWQGGIFLDDRATKAWLPDFAETPIAAAVAETLKHG